MKRWTTILLATFMLFLVGTAASAAELTEADASLRLHGNAMKLHSGRLKLSTEDGTYFLNISGDTLIMDAVTHEKLALRQVKDNRPVYAYVSAAMTFSLPPQTHAFVVLANLPEGYTPPSLERAQEQYYLMNRQWAMTWGSVQSKGERQLLIENSNPNDHLSPIWLNFTENSIIVDTVEGEDRTLKDIGEGEIVYAFIRPYILESYPPQGEPILLLCDIPADFAVPMYSFIDGVTPVEEGLRLRSDGGETYLVDDSCILLSHRTDNIAQLSDLRAGRGILVWLDEGKPSKIMIFA